VANASPAADAVPILLAAEAMLVLVRASGERRVAATEFFTGYRRTQLAADELLYAVEIPPLPGPAWFRKVGTRAANAISKIVCAGVRGQPPRLAFGSVAPTVVRGAAHRGRPGQRRLAGRGGPPAAGRDRAIDDLRSTAAYRRRVAAALLKQFWEETAP
jgi:CO/xanthine dehydrogenase FAD-binding subunit